MTVRKYVIEVALPLEAINKVWAGEKSIRYGQPFQRAPDFGGSGVNYNLSEVIARTTQPA